VGAGLRLGVKQAVAVKVVEQVTIPTRKVALSNRLEMARVAAAL
jgi:hypothetical protein